MSSLQAWAILLGLSLGFGIWILLSRMPIFVGPKLARRIEPYVASASSGMAAATRTRSANDRLPASLIGQLFGRLNRPVIPRFKADSVVELRLRQSGSSATVQDFRFEQLIWMLAFSGVSLVLQFLLGPIHLGNALVRILLIAFGGLLGILCRAKLLERSASRRLSRMKSELPVVLEFLALCLSAGESILDSLKRIADLGKGELAAELGKTVRKVNAGMPLAVALRELETSLQLVPLTRCVDQLLSALDRGTPLAEVLKAQVQDSKEQFKRDLLETAGKKEVAMMFPLVFGVLPVSVIFAIFPGVFVLQLGF
ncbi:MAG: type II secretion system F family protein [Microbacteriaceae bacterium]|nr:type II secretion system F family protein [Microbacteriaceae bacterium]